MGSTNESSILRLNRYPSRTVVGVGLSSNRGVFLQEYWLGGNPHYSVANTSDNPVRVSIAQWNAGNIGQVIVSWTIAPRSVEFYKIQEEVSSYNGALIAVSLNENFFIGLLKTPQMPVIENWTQEILTIDGLNGIGDRYANIECWQPRLVFGEDETISLTLSIPRNLGDIFLNEAPAQNYLPQATVIEMFSPTLLIKKIDGAFKVSSEAASQIAKHEVSLLLKLPAVKNQTMVAFIGRVSVANGGNFSFARGLVVDKTE